MHVEFHPAALAESEEAQTWYAERSLIAAASFLRELSVAVQRAAEAPRRYPSGPAATRRVVLDRYPFTRASRRDSARILPPDQSLNKFGPQLTVGAHPGGGRP